LRYQPLRAKIWHRQLGISFLEVTCIYWSPISISMIWLPSIYFTSKDFFIYVILICLMFVTVHKLQIIHFRHSVYFTPYIYISVYKVAMLDLKYSCTVYNVQCTPFLYYCNYAWWWHYSDCIECCVDWLHATSICVMYCA